ncbi:MAG TPA: HEAT repeat domain-containing protein [Rhizomicrobium sp.]|jgi:hypothetical protein|nr:HEAT repeat domain-containing protein [Rhizomicrobium sp.]
MSGATVLPWMPDDVKEAIRKLKSLHDGDIGVVETIACGKRAIPSLSAVLFAREPSGLYETRRRAVEALAALGAHDVLREFLCTPRDISDPVELTGEEAVINAAARALGKLGDRGDLPFLLSLLREKPLAGVIEAVGRFRCIESLPLFIEALAEDFYRPAAEAAIRMLGTKARADLMQAATDHRLAFGRETGASILRRRSALALLREIGLPRKWPWRAFPALLQDCDPTIAVLACGLSLDLASAPRALKHEAVRRLIALLPVADGLLSAEIEDRLTGHFAAAKSLVVDAISAERRVQPEPRDWPDHRVLTALLRVEARAGGCANFDHRDPTTTNHQILKGNGQDEKR